MKLFRPAVPLAVLLALAGLALLWPPAPAVQAQSGAVFTSEQAAYESNYRAA
jgi:hypothetical protein